MKKQVSSFTPGSLHTPGPWYFTGQISGGHREFPIYKQHGAYAHPATATNEADARLIAAAPELLAALESIIEADAANSGAEPSISVLYRAIDEARAIVKKARGE